MSSTVSYLEIIKPPSKNPQAGSQRSGGDGMYEVDIPADLSAKKLMIVGNRGGAPGFAQSSGGASESKGKPMSVKKVLEKAKSRINEAGIEMGQDNDPKYSREHEVDRINYQFDNVFRNKFANPYLIVNAVAAILERFSINCPVMDPSGRSEVFVLHIHSNTGTDAFVYIAIERDGRGQYDAFVQMVDAGGLAALHGVVHAHEHEVPTLPDYPSHWTLLQRHTGNI